MCRDLLPYVEKRDLASVAVSGIAASSQEQARDLALVETEAMRLSRENVDLAAEILELAGQVESRGPASVEEPSSKEALKVLQQEVKASRRKWDIIKGTASAIVVGSGVDWVADPHLTDMVLDT
jgi:hypothetical protein